MKRALLFASLLLLFVVAGTLPMLLGQARAERALRDCFGRPVFDRDGFRCEGVSP